MRTFFYVLIATTLSLGNFSFCSVQPGRLLNVPRTLNSPTRDLNGPNNPNPVPSTSAIDYFNFNSDTNLEPNLLRRGTDILKVLNPAERPQSVFKNEDKKTASYKAYENIQKNTQQINTTLSPANIANQRQSYNDYDNIKQYARALPLKITKQNDDKTTTRISIKSTAISTQNSLHYYDLIAESQFEKLKLTEEQKSTAKDNYKKSFGELRAYLYKSKPDTVDVLFKGLASIVGLKILLPFLNLGGISIGAFVLYCLFKSSPRQLLQENIDGFGPQFGSNFLPNKQPGLRGLFSTVKSSVSNLTVSSISQTFLGLPGFVWTAAGKILSVNPLATELYRSKFSSWIGGGIAEIREGRERQRKEEEHAKAIKELRDKLITTKNKCKERKKELEKKNNETTTVVAEKDTTILQMKHELELHKRETSPAQTFLETLPPEQVAKLAFQFRVTTEQFRSVIEDHPLTNNPLLNDNDQCAPQQTGGQAPSIEVLLQRYNQTREAYKKLVGNFHKLWESKDTFLNVMLGKTEDISAQEKRTKINSKNKDIILKAMRQRIETLRTNVKKTSEEKSYAVQERKNVKSKIETSKIQKKNFIAQSWARVTHSRDAQNYKELLQEETNLDQKVKNLSTLEKVTEQNIANLEESVKSIENLNLQQDPCQLYEQALVKKAMGNTFQNVILTKT